MSGVDDFERDSGRATRARTRLIVEGFSNLAVIAIFFAGVQAQLISVTNNENGNTLAVATNAAFFGGLIFCVFTAVLATLSARWFSILREDDSDYLSSRWLSQDCSAICRKKDTESGPDLKDYLDFQIESLRETRRKAEAARDRLVSQNSQLDQPRHSRDPAQRNTQSTLSADSIQKVAVTRADPGLVAAKTKFDPTTYDIDCLIKLLEKERGSIDTPKQESDKPGDVESGRLGVTGDTTSREKVLGYALFSPLIAAFPSFILFILGILFLTWNKFPNGVAIFATAISAICVLPLCCFFLRHRHKHVIKNLYLGRPSW